MAKILVTVPNQGWMRQEVAGALVAFFTDQRHQPVLWFPQYVPLENGLQHVWNHLRKSDCDFWLNLDDDTIPKKNLLDLVEEDYDVVGFPYPILRDTLEGGKVLHWSAYRYDPGQAGYVPQEPQDGLQEVSAVGGGAILVAKRVWMDRKLAVGSWERERASDGTVRRGNDLAWCFRVRAAGWRIWTHWGYPCAHVKEVDLMRIVGPPGGAHGRKEGKADGADDAPEGVEPERVAAVGG